MIGASTKKKIQHWWDCNCRSFIFPAFYGTLHHKHRWETIELGVIGCTDCGILHVCSIAERNCVPCALEIQKDSSAVCVYSGLVISLQCTVHEDISVDEYMSGHAVLYGTVQTKKRKLQSNEEKIEIIKGMTWRAIDTLLYSRGTKMAYEHERKKNVKKIETAFLNAIHNDSYGFRKTDIISCLEYVIQYTSSNRSTPSVDFLPPRRHWNFLVQNITMLLLWINIPKPYCVTESNDRMFNLIVSLVYMSSRGICSNNVIFLHKNYLLKDILPMEPLLFQCFHLNTKNLTEGENIIKLCINEMCKTKKAFNAEKYHGCLFSSENNTCTCI